MSNTSISATDSATASPREPFAAPSAPDGAAVCPFDHHSPAFTSDLHGEWDRARGVAPLIWTDAHGGYWVTTNHALTRKVAIDSDAFTVSRAPGRVGGILIPPPPGAELRPRFVPGEADGEEHDHYRLALNPHFSKQRVSEIEPMIARHVQGTLDRIKAAGDFDIAHDLVAPILAGVACEHMGLEVDEPRAFFTALHTMIQAGTAGGEGVQTEFDRAWSEIVRTVDERRAEPRTDVITALTQWEPAFSDEQIHMMILNVSLGANDTTKSLLVQALIYLDQHPELRQQLSDDPSMIKAAVDEFIRLVPVATGPCRTATRDVEIEGVVIREGEMIMLGFSGANHGPEKYADPHAFDLERGSAQHLGMGVGTHFCLGAWMAKSIAEMTIRELLQQCPNFTIDHDNLQISENRSAATHIAASPAHVGKRS